MARDLDGIDFTAQPSSDPRQSRKLATCRWVANGEALLLHRYLDAPPSFLAVFGLLVVLRLPVAQAIPISLALAAGIVVWGVPVRPVLAASVEGVVIEASILWIVFGAILLLKTLSASGAHADRAGGGRGRLGRRGLADGYALRFAVRQRHLQST